MLAVAAQAEVRFSSKTCTRHACTYGGAFILRSYSDEIEARLSLPHWRRRISLLFWVGTCERENLWAAQPVSHREGDGDGEAAHTAAPTTLSAGLQVDAKLPDTWGQVCGCGWLGARPPRSCPSRTGRRTRASPWVLHPPATVHRAEIAHLSVSVHYTVVVVVLVQFTTTAMWIRDDQQRQQINETDCDTSPVYIYTHRCTPINPVRMYHSIRQVRCIQFPHALVDPACCVPPTGYIRTYSCSYNRRHDDA
jgi:hypothetical protein